jgi:hypothetical protein
MNELLINKFTMTILFQSSEEILFDPALLLRVVPFSAKLQDLFKNNHLSCLNVFKRVQKRQL